MPGLHVVIAVMGENIDINEYLIVNIFSFSLSTFLMEVLNERRKSERFCVPDLKQKLVVLYCSYIILSRTTVQCTYNKLHTAHSAQAHTNF